jgi:hypothetical protein
MAKASLLTAVCAAALLATTPVLAQNSTNPGDAGAGYSPSAQGMPEASPGQTGTPSHMGSRSHHSTTAHHRGSMRPDAQNAEVDRLNQQSYEAAQRGQNFSVGGSSGMSTAPSGGGSMNDTGGGAMGGGGGAPASDSGGKM